MKLRTYRLNQKKYSLKNKFKFMSALYWTVLEKDPYWHYFLDPEGGTLRFSPKFEERVAKWLKKNSHQYGITFRKRLLYDPKRHEYYGVSFLADYTIPLFHDMSVLLTVFPPGVSFWPTHERLNHGLLNMFGIHDFVAEAAIYLNLAEGRVGLVGETLPLPKWVYHQYWKLRRLLHYGLKRIGF